MIGGFPSPRREGGVSRSLSGCFQDAFRMLFRMLSGASRGRPGSVPERSGSVPARPGSVRERPGASRSVPGAPRTTSRRPKTAPRRPKTAISSVNPASASHRRRPDPSTIFFPPRTNIHSTSSASVARPVIRQPKFPGLGRLRLVRSIFPYPMSHGKGFYSFHPPVTTTTTTSSSSSSS